MDRYILQVLEANSLAIKEVYDTQSIREESYVKTRDHKVALDREYLDKYNQARVVIDEEMNAYLRSVKGVYDVQFNEKRAVIDRNFEDNFDKWILELFDAVVSGDE